MANATASEQRAAARLAFAFDLDPRVEQDERYNVNFGVNYLRKSYMAASFYEARDYYSD